jgi:hypothetical protein
MAAAAKSNGAERRTVPCHSVAIQFTNRTPSGTISESATSIVAYWKPAGIVAEYMFCIHESGMRTAIADIATATARWLKMGLRAIVGRISEITPAANSTTIV